ncbi:unnamed protein product [Rotaria magnacalcarata]
MATRTSRVLSSSSSLSRSRSPIPKSDKRNLSVSPRRGPSTPIKSPIQRNHSDDEQDPDDRERLPLDDQSTAIVDEISSPIMSDIDESHEKKRSHHRHHHHRKHSKSNKRLATHHRTSVKRSKKETVSMTQCNKSNDENIDVSPEKNTGESQQSQSEQDVSTSENESNEEGMVEGDSTPNERPSRHRRKKHHSSSNQEKNSQTSQSPSFSIPKNNKGTQLIVNYLPASLRESDFYQLFARIAPIKLCKLITDRYTGQSYCYGFIEYHSKDDTIKAIEKFNGYRIEHKKLKVSYAQPKSNNNYESDNDKPIKSSSTQKNSNIYITDLPDDIDENMLERLFSKYGDIVQTKVLRDPRTRISRGVAFVLMKSARYAERAVKALDGYVPSGAHTPISVKYADLNKTAAITTTSSGKNGSNSSSSRLSSSSPMTPPIGPYGYPTGLPPLSMIDPYYAAALHHHHRATMNMRDLSPSPPPLQPYFRSDSSRSSRIRGSSPSLPRSYPSSSSKHNSNILATTGNLNSPSALAAAYDLIAKGCQQAIDPNGFVIYAFGLPHDCDENDLEELFRRYGDVYRVYIVRNYTTGESKGYSFVTMRNYDEACHAVDRLDGTTFKGRTIQVRFKQ